MEGVQFLLGEDGREVRDLASGQSWDKQEATSQSSGGVGELQLVLLCGHAGDWGTGAGRSLECTRIGGS